MSEPHTIDREQETGILLQLREAYKTSRNSQTNLKRAQNNIKQANLAIAGLKRTLFLCRYGQAALEQRQRQMQKMIQRGAEVRAKNKAAVDALIVQAATTPHSSAREMPEALKAIYKPKTLEPISIASLPTLQVEPRCPACKTPITTRGLCACPGVKHRNFRRVEPGPKLNITHPPVPPFQMGADKET